MKTLILVESPTKAKTLDRFLKGKYEIEASYGHIRDLPKGNLGVDVEHDFEPKYVIPKEKRKVIENLKARLKGVDRIILATDPDREGEAISFHLHEILKKETDKKTKFERIVFHEITEEAIKEALDHPRQIDSNLVSAQTARRVLDRIVGYKLSPVLWRKIQKRLSAGRVQSIALRLIVEREKEIGKFDKRSYYRLFAVAHKKDDSTPIEFELLKINGEGVEKQEKISLYDGEYKYTLTSFSKSQIEKIKETLLDKDLTITNIVQKDSKKSPYPPFTTSIMQQESFRRLGYSSKKTMSIAQRLYEEGFISYHRTDSFNLSVSFINNARKVIEKDFGKEYLSDGARIFKTKSKLAQEAHEAIRPTKPAGDHEQVKKELGKDFFRLYDLIYKRAMATQMADAQYSSTKIEAEAKDGETYAFEANGRILKFPGYLKLWFFEEEEQTLPNVTVGEKLKPEEINISELESNPPPRYNEASLIAALEKHGIGRPSTYAPIISTIIDRSYIERTEGRFTPTPIGTIVNDFLVKNFSTIDDIPFTSQMEDELDLIAGGQREWTKVIAEFYKPFEKTLEEADKQEKIEVEPEKTGKICPECGGDIVVKRSRFGKFYACSNFPKCTYKESYKIETNYNCPKCAGKVIIKKTRRGRIFYGCSNYPKCDFAVWNKSELEKNQPQAKPTEPAN